MMRKKAFFSLKVDLISTILFVGTFGFLKLSYVVLNLVCRPKMVIYFRTSWQQTHYSQSPFLPLSRSVFLPYHMVNLKIYHYIKRFLEREFENEIFQNSMIRT